jgi:fructose-1,6-bisphosphatase I
MNLGEHLLKRRVEEELSLIINHLADSSKYIALMMRESNRKFAGTVNKSGDKQLELDILADEMLMQRLRSDTSFNIQEFASEEQDKIIEISNGNGKYSVSVDPLDGSSLVDVNLAVGTIMGIYKGQLLEFDNPRDNLTAAMYVQYGPLTTLVYSTGKGTHEFVLDPSGNFILNNECIQLKESGKIYSPGGLRKDWLPGHTKFIDKLEEEGYKLRYSGGLVPDINQILLKGNGIFTYPALKNAENGKLRLLFELQPMGFLVEQAGGKATNGLEDILDIAPTEIDQRSPIYIGTKYEVELAKSYLI